MAGVEARQLFVGHYHAIAQARLLAEDHGLGIHADRIIHLVVVDEAFAQAGIGAMGAALVERGVFGVKLLRDVVLHRSAALVLGCFVSG